ncbi:3-carboxy-cis,cis-mucoante lactonizing enzyme [Microthyrium microscopicum]|uniref:3-carboxy-cis,cis-mucoante lactonizing enzyme n=1 Tax=Microthyrium microscopicum TaxID=703497 RepID=A0A6A6UFR7_9PEZI|nr:3-carboxy-cis,cis-mucoante lactonizing enzyme [Microthyrium microscopicum]
MLFLYLLIHSLGLVKAAKHQLFTSTYGTPFIYTVEFDDEANTLKLLANTSVPAASQWLVLSHDKKNLYGTSTTDKRTEFLSYAVTSPTSIKYKTTTVAGTCAARTIHVDALQVPPYTVYGVPWYGADNNCGGVMAVDDQGVIVKSVQNYTYSPGSALHGLAFHPEGTFMYSADLKGKKLWTHAIDRATGKLTLVTSDKSHGEPRHVSVHPKGKYAYAMLEDTNEVSVYSIDSTTGAAKYTGKSHSVLSSKDKTAHRAATVRLSASGNMLYATTRGSRTPGAKGSVSAFTLKADGSIASQDFIIPTTTGGGGANQVAPTIFDDNYFAIIDSGTGFIEMWKRNKDGAGAAVIAHLDLADSTRPGNGCCSNAVWYS